MKTDLGLTSISQISMVSVRKALKILIFKYTTILIFWMQSRVQSPFLIWIDNPFIYTNLLDSIGPVLVRSGRTRPAILVSGPVRVRHSYVQSGWGLVFRVHSMEFKQFDNYDGLLKPNSRNKVFFSHSNYLPDKFY